MAAAPAAVGAIPYGAARVAGGRNEAVWPGRRGPPEQQPDSPGRSPAGNNVAAASLLKGGIRDREHAAADGDGVPLFFSAQM